jgi:proteasome lid subunit RPN8/RPN11
MNPAIWHPLSPAIEAEIRRHCEAQYPHEACGALIGSGDGETQPWRVEEIRTATNAHGEDHARRYLIPPEFQVQVEKYARETERDVIGYYHSHPDHKSDPSEYDRVHAWPGYLYLIFSVWDGKSADYRALALASDGYFADVDSHH